MQTTSRITGLNTVQLTAVEAEDGPVLVLASPGTGKSAVIIASIEVLICEGMEPSQIMAMTFTTKAA